MSAIYETKTVTKQVRVGWKCDSCGMEIPKGQKMSVAWSHGDWGNDSIESYRSADVCSPECYKDVVTEVCIAPDYNSRTSRIDEVPVSVWKHILNIKDK